MTEFPGKFCSEWEWRVFTESVRWHRVTELKEKGKGCNWQHACFLIYKALGLIDRFASLVVCIGLSSSGKLVEMKLQGECLFDFFPCSIAKV